MYAIRDDGKRIFIKGFGSSWKEDEGLYHTDFCQPGVGWIEGIADIGDNIRFMDGTRYTVVPPYEVLMSSRRKRFVEERMDFFGDYIGPEWPIVQGILEGINETDDIGGYYD